MRVAENTTRDLHDRGMCKKCEDGLRKTPLGDEIVRIADNLCDVVNAAWVCIELVDQTL